MRACQGTGECLLVASPGVCTCCGYSVSLALRASTSVVSSPRDFSAPGHRSAHYFTYTYSSVVGPLVQDLLVVALLVRQVLASGSFHVTTFSHGLAVANIADMTCHIDYRTCMHACRLAHDIASFFFWSWGTSQKVCLPCLVHKQEFRLIDVFSEFFVNACPTVAGKIPVAGVDAIANHATLWADKILETRKDLNNNHSHPRNRRNAAIRPPT